MVPCRTPQMLLSWQGSCGVSLPTVPGPTQPFVWCLLCTQQMLVE